MVKIKKNKTQRNKHKYKYIHKKSNAYKKLHAHKKLHTHKHFQISKINKTKKSNCSPQKNKKKYTCYTNQSLHLLKKYWNVRHPDSKITTNDVKEIWSQLKHNMNNVCENEACWLRQKFIKGNLNNELLNYTFAPKAPDVWKNNPNEWLTSVDIDKVMKQYEHVYSNFVFLGPSPIDFDHRKVYSECVWEELCNFNLHNHLNKGKTKIGIVFNLDPHYKSGSHWIAMFIDLSKKYIFFLDSNGDKIPKQIMKLVKRIQSQAKAINMDLPFYQNHPFQHQKKNTECGIYVLYFITNLLKGTKHMNYFKNHRIPDKEMSERRDGFFNLP